MYRISILFSVIFFSMPVSAFAGVDNPPFPARESFVITRGYNTPDTHINENQYAIDFTQNGCDAFRKTALAVSNGKILKINNTSKWGGGYGYNVMVSHGDSLLSRYAHLDEVLITEGDVQHGQAVGLIGNTGYAPGIACKPHPGTHLHFAMYKDGAAYKPEPMEECTVMKSGASPCTNFAAGSWYRHDGIAVEEKLQPVLTRILNPRSGEVVVTKPDNFLEGAWWTMRDGAKIFGEGITGFFQNVFTGQGASLVDSLPQPDAQDSVSPPEFASLELPRASDIASLIPRLTATPPADANDTNNAPLQEQIPPADIPIPAPEPFISQPPNALPMPEEVPPPPPASAFGNDAPYGPLGPSARAPLGFSGTQGVETPAGIFHIPLDPGWTAYGPPSVAAGPDETYIVVWPESKFDPATNGYDTVLRAALFNSRGGVENPAHIIIHTVTSDGGAGAWPHVVYGAGTYLVTFETTDQTGDTDLFGMRLDAHGDVRDATPFAIASNDSLLVWGSDVAFTGTDFLVTWVTVGAGPHLYGSAGAIAAARVSADAVVTMFSGSIYSNGGYLTPRITNVACAHSTSSGQADNASHCLVVWLDNYKWMARRMDLSGGDSPGAFTVMPSNQTAQWLTRPLTWDGTRYLVGGATREGIFVRKIPDAYYATVPVLVVPADDPSAYVPPVAVASQHGVVHLTFTRTQGSSWHGVPYTASVSPEDFTPLSEKALGSEGADTTASDIACMYDSCLAAFVQGPIGSEIIVEAF